jgi:opacity protein-like surface antigen
MKFKAAVLGVALLTVSVGAAHAGSNWIGFSGGAGIPTGDYGDAAATGWHIGATGTHMMNDQWGIGGDLAYHAWGGSDELNAATEAAFGPNSEITWSAIQANVHGTMMFPTKSTMKPYAQAGVGLYNVSAKLSSPSGDDDTSKSKLGFNFGGGMDFAGSGNMHWGVDAGYHLISAKDDLGADVNFFTVGVNLMWGLSTTQGN